MKRFIAILLVLLSIISYSFAEAPEQAETIKFSGLDWFITRDEFEVFMKSNDMQFQVVEYEDKHPRKGIWEPFYGKSYDMYNSTKPIDYFYTNYSKGGDNILTRVAGYATRSIQAYFLPTYSLENLTVGEPYRLVRATYVADNLGDLQKKFNGLTLEEVYYDLKGKITSLYGEPYADLDNGDGTYKKVVVWYAKDGTGIVMGLKGFLYLTYGIADDAKYINELYEVYDKITEQTLNNNTSTDGL